MILAVKTLLRITDAPEATRDLGTALGRWLEPGDVVCLDGELGSGKTCFVQGIARGLGVEDRWITSPTFTLINEYKGRYPLYHADLYRLGPLRSLRDLGMEDLLYGKGITVVEWADRLGEERPDERLDVLLEWTGLSERRVILTAHGIRAAGILERIAGE